MSSVRLTKAVKKEKKTKKLFTLDESLKFRPTVFRKAMNNCAFVRLGLGGERDENGDYTKHKYRESDGQLVGPLYDPISVYSVTRLLKKERDNGWVFFIRSDVRVAAKSVNGDDRRSAYDLIRQYIENAATHPTNKIKFQGISPRITDDEIARHSVRNDSFLPNNDDPGFLDYSELLRRYQNEKSCKNFETTWTLEEIYFASKHIKLAKIVDDEVAKADANRIAQYGREPINFVDRATSLANQRKAIRVGKIVFDGNVVKKLPSIPLAANDDGTYKDETNSFSFVAVTLKNGNRIFIAYPRITEDKKDVKGYAAQMAEKVNFDGNYNTLRKLFGLEETIQNIRQNVSDQDLGTRRSSRAVSAPGESKKLSYGSGRRVPAETSSVELTEPSSSSQTVRPGGSSRKMTPSPAEKPAPVSGGGLKGTLGKRPPPQEGVRQPGRTSGLQT